MKVLLIVFTLLSSSCFASLDSTQDEQDIKVLETDNIRWFLGDNYIPRSTWGKIPVDYNKLLASGEISLDEVKEIASLHHTVTGSNYSIDGYIKPEDEYITVQDVEKLHIDERSFHDVGYHYMIGQSGKVYEGRPVEYIGSHTKELNMKNAGIAFIGCYDDEGCIKEGYKVTDVSDEMIESAASLIAYLSVNKGLPISPETIIPRSTYDISKKGNTKFPYSPGNRIIEKVAEIVNRSTEKITSIEAGLVKK